VVETNVGKGEVIFSYPQGMIFFNISLWVYELSWYMSFAFKLRHCVLIVTIRVVSIRIKCSQATGFYPIDTPPQGRYEGWGKLVVVLEIEQKRVGIVELE
jgi:hypothetical protein